MFISSNCCVLLSSHSVMSVSDSLWPHGHRLLCPWNSPGKNTGVGCHFLVEDMFSTQGLNPSLINCRQFLCHWATREALKRQYGILWHPTPVLLPGKSHGRRNLVGCSPWGLTTERLHFRFSLSCIGEGNGNPLQCSCLENPRDRGAWWAAFYGVAQSQTRLKWLSSSSSSIESVDCVW